MKYQGKTPFMNNEHTLKQRRTGILNRSWLVEGTREKGRINEVDKSW
jgi:hypothetical protein